MPDLDLIKQEEQGKRDERCRFLRGRLGNPGGRPKGCGDHVNRAAGALLSGESEALARKSLKAGARGALTRREAMQARANA